MWALRALMSAWQMYIIIIIIIYRARVHNTRSNRTITHVVYLFFHSHITLWCPAVSEEGQLYPKKKKKKKSQKFSSLLLVIPLDLPTIPCLQFRALILALDLGGTTHIHVDICMHVSTHMLFNKEWHTHVYSCIIIGSFPKLQATRTYHFKQNICGQTLTLSMPCLPRRQSEKKQQKCQIWNH